MLQRALLMMLGSIYVMLSFTLAGCSPEVHSSSSEQSGSLNIAFSGPYAAQLKESYENASSDFVRNVLADGVVSDSEFSELQNRLLTCWRDHGYKQGRVEADGKLSVEDRTDISEEEEAKIFSQCSEQAGVPEIEGLYWSMRNNPDNLDWPSAERDCLVRAGLLEAGTSVDEMNQWYANGGVGSRSHAAYVCSQDALGHLGLQ